MGSKKKASKKKQGKSPVRFDRVARQGGFKLEAGSAYVRRDGVLTDPLTISPRGIFYDAKHGYYYWPSGFAVGNGPGSKADLVEKDSFVDSDIHGFGTPSLVDLDSHGFNAAARQHLVLMNRVFNELRSAQANYPAFNSLHEAYSVLREEMDELWEEVRKKQKVGSEVNLERVAGARREGIQVVAMALRLLLDCCDKNGAGYGK